MAKPKNRIIVVLLITEVPWCKKVLSIGCKANWRAVNHTCKYTFDFPAEFSNNHDNRLNTERETLITRNIVTTGRNNGRHVRTMDESRIWLNQAYLVALETGCIGDRIKDLGSVLCLHGRPRVFKAKRSILQARVNTISCHILYRIAKNQLQQHS